MADTPRSPLSRVLSWFEGNPTRLLSLIAGIILSSLAGMPAVVLGVAYDSLLLKVIGYLLVAPGGLFVAATVIAAKWDDRIASRSKSKPS